MFEKSLLHPLKNNRHSLRMRGYDYSSEGVYFITIATSQRVCLFGKADNGKIVLNTFGKFAFEQWIQLQQRFHPSEFPKFTILPNHIHGIIHIVRGAGEESQMNRVEIPPLRYTNIPDRRAPTIIRTLHLVL